MVSPPHNLRVTIDLRIALGPSAAGQISDPRVVLLAGGAVTSVTGILVKVAGESAATTTMFRCGLALPFLALLAWREWRRHGALSRRVAAAHLFGGAMLGADFALWAQSIEMMGAGIATVVANVQVVVVPLLAWLVFRARIPSRSSSRCSFSSRASPSPAARSAGRVRAGT